MAAHVLPPNPNQIRMNQLEKLLQNSEVETFSRLSRIKRSDTVHDFKSFTSNQIPLLLENMFKFFGDDPDPTYNGYMKFFQAIGKSISTSTPTNPLDGLRAPITPSCTGEVFNHGLTFERNANIYFDNCNLENIFNFKNESTTWKYIIDIDQTKYADDVFLENLKSMEDTIFITGWNGTNYNDEKYDIIMDNDNQIRLGRYILYYLFGKLTDEVYLTFDSRVDKTKLALKYIPNAIQLITPQQISDSASSQMDVFSTKGQVRKPIYYFHEDTNIAFLNNSYMYTSLFWSKNIFDLYIQDNDFNDTESANGVNGFKFILNIKTGNFSAASDGFKIFTPEPDYQYSPDRSVIMDYMDVIGAPAQGPSKETLARMSNHIYINRERPMTIELLNGGGNFLLKKFNYNMISFVVELYDKLIALFFSPPAVQTGDDIKTINMYIIAFLIDLKRTGDYEQVNLAKLYALSNKSDSVVFTTGDVLCFAYAKELGIPAILESITKNGTKTLVIHRVNNENSVDILNNLIIKFLKFKKDFLYYYKSFNDINITLVLNKLNDYKNELIGELNIRIGVNGPPPHPKAHLTELKNNIIISIISLFIIYKIDDIIIYYTKLLFTINKIVYNKGNNGTVNNVYREILNIDDDVFADEASAAHFLNTTTIKSKINDICTFSDNIMTLGEISKLVNLTKSKLNDAERINYVVPVPVPPSHTHVYGLNNTHGEPLPTAANAADNTNNLAVEAADAASAAGTSTPLDDLVFTQIISIVVEKTPILSNLDNFLNLFQFNLDIIKHFYTALEKFNKISNNKISKINEDLNTFAKYIRKNIDISTFFYNENYTSVFNKLFNQLNDTGSLYNAEDAFKRCTPPAVPAMYKLKVEGNTNCMQIKFTKMNILKHIFNELVCKRGGIDLYLDVKITRSCMDDISIPNASGVIDVDAAAVSAAAADAAADAAAAAAAAPAAAAAAPAAAAAAPAAAAAAPAAPGAPGGGARRNAPTVKALSAAAALVESRKSKYPTKGSSEEREIKKKLDGFDKNKVVQQRHRARLAQEIRTTRPERLAQDIHNKRQARLDKYIVDIGDIYINSINNLYLYMMNKCNKYIKDSHAYIPLLLEYSFLYNFNDILNKNYNRSKTIYTYENNSKKFGYKWVKNKDNDLEDFENLIKTHIMLFTHYPNIPPLSGHIRELLKPLLDKKNDPRESEKLVQDLFGVGEDMEFKNRKKQLYDACNDMIQRMKRSLWMGESPKVLYNILIDYVNKLNNDLNDYCNTNMIDFNINILDDEGNEIISNTTPIDISDPSISNMNELLKELNKVANTLEYCMSEHQERDEEYSDEEYSDIENKNCEYNKNNVYFTVAKISDILFNLASYKNIIDMRYSPFYEIFKNEDFLPILNLHIATDEITHIEKNGEKFVTKNSNFLMSPIPYDEYNMGVIKRLIHKSKEAINNIISRKLEYYEEQKADADADSDADSDDDHLEEDNKDDYEYGYINEPCPVLLPESVLFRTKTLGQRPNIGELNNKLYMVFHKARKASPHINILNRPTFNLDSMDRLGQGLEGGKTKKKKKKRKKSRKKYKRNNIKRKKSRKKYKRNINTKKH